MWKHCGAPESVKMRRPNSRGNLKLLDQGKQNPRQFISLEIKLLEVRLHNSVRILQNVNDSCHLKNATSGNDKKNCDDPFEKSGQNLQSRFFRDSRQCSARIAAVDHALPNQPPDWKQAIARSQDGKSWISDKQPDSRIRWLSDRTFALGVR